MFFDFGFFEQHIGYLIFFARVTDVSLGTVRNLYVNAGLKTSAAVAGFFQMIVWVFAVAGLINDLNDFSRIILYAAGFSTGTIVGMWIEEKIALGFRQVTIMNHNDEIFLAESLRSNGYNVTQVPAKGFSNNVEVIIAILQRKEMQKFSYLVDELAPDAFYSVEKVGTPHSRHKNRSMVLRLIDPFKKIKWH